MRTPTWPQASATEILRGACRHARVEWPVQRTVLPSLLQSLAEHYRRLVQSYDWPETSAAVEVAFEGGLWDATWSASAGIPSPYHLEHIYYYEGQYWNPQADAQITAGVEPAADLWSVVEEIETRFRFDGPAGDTDEPPHPFPAPTIPTGSIIFGIYQADPAATPAKAGRPLRHRHYAAGWVHVVTPPGVLTVWVHHAPPAPRLENLEEWSASTAYTYSASTERLVWTASGDGKIYRLKANSSAGTVPSDGATWELIPLPARLADMLARFIASDLVNDQEGDTPRAAGHLRRAEALLDTALGTLAASLR